MFFYLSDGTLPESSLLVSLLPAPLHIIQDFIIGPLISATSRKDIDGNQVQTLEDQRALGESLSTSCTSDHFMFLLYPPVLRAAPVSYLSLTLLQAWVGQAKSFGLKISPLQTWLFQVYNLHKPHL